MDDGTLLYAGGSFRRADAVSADRIARWDGSSWSPLGSGMSSDVYALTVFDDGLGRGPALYAGGGFTLAGGGAANRIARWDGVEWTPLGDGVSGSAHPTVHSMAVFDDGQDGPALYVGGWFTSAGGQSADFIARWDGTSWSPVGGGLNGPVMALTVFHDGSGPALYAGGSFTIAGSVAAVNIARWNGTEWQPLGPGVNGSVYALAEYDDGDGVALYAGGMFSQAGGAPAGRIARWRSGVWSSLSGIVDMDVNGSAVYALTVFDEGKHENFGPSLMVGGDFTGAGGWSTPNLAKWTDHGWWPSQSTNNVVHALAAIRAESQDDTLLVGGSFDTASGVQARRIAQYQFGSGWSTVGDLSGLGLSNRVYALAVQDGMEGVEAPLYAAGQFRFAGGATINRVARLDGDQWSPLGSGMTHVPSSNFTSVYALAEYDDGNGGALYAGGFFTRAGGMTARYIAKWDGAQWSEVGGGLSGTGRALAVFEDDSGPALYVAGTFVRAGSVIVNNIARWDGVQWTSLGGGTNGPVHALHAATGPDGRRVLYAGGAFTEAGGVAARNIAAWTGTEWQAIAEGVDGNVHAIEGSGESLFVGGRFERAGVVDARNIARWDGMAWSPLAGGIAGDVRALQLVDEGAMSGPVLMVGGLFSSAGQVAASNIARWNGTTWSPLDGGVGGFSTTLVSALAVRPDAGGNTSTLFVGGRFSMAGEYDSSHIALWRICECAAGDLNCDGVVNLSDLLLLLASWGTCSDPMECSADLNGDGAVDAVDLMMLLERWGLVL